MYEFYKKSKERNIKPILGCEFYCGEKDDKNKYHLVLLAKNEIGLKNIFNLLYKGYDNFYSRPRIQYKDLEEHKEGLICLSACIGGEVAKEFLRGDIDEAISTATYFKTLFGDDYYLEIQPNHMELQKNFNLFVQTMCSNGFKPIVTCDAHYISKEDYNTHDTMLCLKINKKKSDENRFKFPVNDLYVKDNVEVLNELKTYLDLEFIQESINNTYEVSNKCNVEIKSKDLLPKMPGIDNEKLKLAELCNVGFAKRKEQGHYNGMDLSKVIERISYELENICSKGYAGYFLIVEDLISYCKSNDIPVGCGRGSVAGSEIAFILGITEAEPMKYGLLYERFLNPTRNSPPDKHLNVLNVELYRNIQC